MEFPGRFGALAAVPWIRARDCGPCGFPRSANGLHVRPRRLIRLGRPSDRWKCRRFPPARLYRTRLEDRSSLGGPATSRAGQGIRSGYRPGLCVCGALLSDVPGTRRVSLLPREKPLCRYYRSRKAVGQMENLGFGTSIAREMAGPTPRFRGARSRRQFCRAPLAAAPAGLRCDQLPEASRAKGLAWPGGLRAMREISARDTGSGHFTRNAKRFPPIRKPRTASATVSARSASPER